MGEWYGDPKSVWGFTGGGLTEVARPSANSQTGPAVNSQLASVALPPAIAPWSPAPLPPAMSRIRPESPENMGIRLGGHRRPRF